MRQEFMCSGTWVQKDFGLKEELQAEHLRSLWEARGSIPPTLSTHTDELVLTVPSTSLGSTEGRKVGGVAWSPENLR